jgi:hypothetical protein
MASLGNSAHIYRLDDGKFRLTFVNASPGGASVLSEIGDFTRWELQEWLKDHLHPSTDYDGLLMSFETQTESTVALGVTLLRTHFEDEQLVKSPASIEDVCQWMGEYQRCYFADRKITIIAEVIGNRNLKATACFSPTLPDGGAITVSSELMKFSSALKISLLHELIHANLHASGKHDPDDDHGELFKAEVKRLMNAGAYDPLL